MYKPLPFLVSAVEILAFPFPTFAYALLLCASFPPPFFVSATPQN